ncbi:hypothetical protein [Halorientalis pallida]|uniref:Uncharacterized protein n=1 Tax=Halorientalis pallida TaxID=2479928 RepID=A0A498KUW9_9EURY|nr:hypothetical protein [Halorientalis pallida]RXK48690.1 hypothetical protein EAF64_13545 [Halorientalis pallida]
MATSRNSNDPLSEFAYWIVGVIVMASAVSGSSSKTEVPAQQREIFLTNTTAEGCCVLVNWCQLANHISTRRSVLDTIAAPPTQLPARADTVRGRWLCVIDRPWDTEATGDRRRFFIASAQLQFP